MLSWNCPCYTPIGVKLTTIEGIKESLQERYLIIRNKSEIINALMGTKQEQNETSMEFSNKLLKLGRELKKVDNKWEEIVVESLRRNLIDIRLRQAMSSLGKAISFKEVRKFIISLEEVSKMDTYESYGIRVDSSQRNWQGGQGIRSNVSLRVGNPRTDYSRSRVDNYVREVRCYRYRD